MIRPTLPPHLLATLEALAAGETCADMAVQFGITENAAKKRLRSLCDELGAEHRAHAVGIGYQIGVLQAGELLVLPCVLAEGMPLVALVRARERAGISQQVMARRLGMSAAWLSARENGVKLFPLGLAYRYARIVGLDIDAVPHLAVAS